MNEISKTTLEQLHKQIEKIQCYYKYSLIKFCFICNKKDKCELYNKEKEK